MVCGELQVAGATQSCAIGCGLSVPSGHLFDTGGEAFHCDLYRPSLRTEKDGINGTPFPTETRCPFSTLRAHVLHQESYLTSSPSCLRHTGIGRTSEKILNPSNLTKRSDCIQSRGIPDKRTARHPPCRSAENQWHCERPGASTITVTNPWELSLGF